MAIGVRGTKKPAVVNGDDGDVDKQNDDDVDDKQADDGDDVGEGVEEMKKNWSEAQKDFWEDKGHPREYNDETAPPLHEFWDGRKAGEWKKQSKRAMKGSNKQTGCVCKVGDWHFGNPQGGASGSYSFHCKTSDPITST